MSRNKKFCCPYHAFSRALEAFSDHHGGVNSTDVIENLMALMAEYVALYDTAQERKSMLDYIAFALPRMAAECRGDQGRVPLAGERLRPRGVEAHQ